MEIVDSNQKQLDIHTIITMAVNNLDTGEMPIQTVLVSIVNETQRETCEVVNVGNTVFIGHRGEGKNKNKMVGRPLNVDTGRNYIKNMLKYGAYIQGQGITHYTTQFEGSELLPAMRVIHKKLQETDTEFAVGKTEDEAHVVYIKFGKEPLSEKF
tara:strand:- start:674 stop:1138 length:465 start_codon:yes stop_codon:yes gene_type:complete